MCRYEITLCATRNVISHVQVDIVLFFTDGYAIKYKYKYKYTSTTRSPKGIQCSVSPVGVLKS